MLMCRCVRWVCRGWSCSNRGGEAMRVVMKSTEMGKLCLSERSNGKVWWKHRLLSSMAASVHGLLVTFLFAADTSDTFLSLCGLLAYVIIFHCLCSHSHCKSLLPFMCLRTESHANISEPWEKKKTQTLIVFKGAIFWGLFLCFPTSLGKKMPPT